MTIPAAPVLGTILDTVRLVRPLNVALYGAGTLLGAFVAIGNSAFMLADPWSAACAAMLVGAGAAVLNRVISAERVAADRSGTARAAWAVLSMAGIVVASTVSAIHAAIALGSVALLYGCAALGSRRPALENLTAALVVSTVFPFGALAVGEWASALPAAAFTFLVTSARELLKDVEPRDGLTPVAVRGAVFRRRLASALVGATAVAVPFLSIAFGYPGLFLLLLIPTVAILLVTITRLASVPPDAGPAIGSLKWALVFGLLALAATAP